MDYEDIQYMENNGDNTELDDDGISTSDDGSEKGNSSDDDGYVLCWMQWLIDHFVMLLTIF